MGSERQKIPPLIFIHCRSEKKWYKNSIKHCYSELESQWYGETCVLFQLLFRAKCVYLLIDYAEWNVVLSVAADCKLLTFMRQPCCRNRSQSECPFLHFCSCPPLLCTVLFSFYFFFLLSFPHLSSAWGPLVICLWGSFLPREEVAGVKRKCVCLKGRSLRMSPPSHWLMRGTGAQGKGSARTQKTRTYNVYQECSSCHRGPGSSGRAEMWLRVCVCAQWHYQGSRRCWELGGAHDALVTRGLPPAERIITRNWLKRRETECEEQ